VIQFAEEICADLASASQREWLETNGIGGFASETICGLHTRRYHGLLVAATNPPAGRSVLLSKVEEVLVIGEQHFELSANQYSGVVHPQGYCFLKRFRLDPFPIFTYALNSIELEKRVFMVHGENTVVVQYRVLSRASQPISLEIRPLIAFRDYHRTTHANDFLNRNVVADGGRTTVQPYPDLPPLHFAHDAGQLDAAGSWYYNFEYSREKERGLDYLEDLFNPFCLRFSFANRDVVSIIASTAVHEVLDAEALRQSELARRKSVTVSLPANDFIRTLAPAADQFIVDRGDGKSIIAGYHWFSDWGRDAMIALPGLTLCTHRPEIAKSILKGFASFVGQGMLPNCFPEVGDAPRYNTVDATLWFFEAIRAVHAYTGDGEFLRELYPLLCDIISWHIRGTRYGIVVDSDGLLHAGEPGTQLTWMDAKVGDLVVTPRIGKAVEVQALWYNALRTMEAFAKELNDRAAESFGRLAERASQSFNAKFWNEDSGCLYDVIDDDARDASIRPNQVIALSLPHSMVSLEKAARVLGVVEQQLLTPFGLRTLSRLDPHYRGRHEGNTFSRDTTYHQGTVWPWLMGPYLSAVLRVNGRTPETLARVKALLQPFEDHLATAGIGQISEIFDGDPPHEPRGCIAQAWSVAEILRIAVDVYS
jgi:predicted glycogen debranching enzyme